MKDQTVLMGCFLTVHVYLAISDLSSEIIALHCLICVCICIWIFIYAKHIEVLLLASFSSVFCQCLFVTD